MRTGTAIFTRKQYLETIHGSLEGVEDDFMLLFQKMVPGDDLALDVDLPFIPLDCRLVDVDYRPSWERK